MGMGTNDPANSLACGGQYGINVRGNCRSRIKHGNVLIAEQVGIGSGASHDTRIRCNNSPDPAVQAKGDSVFQHNLDHISDSNLWIDLGLVIHTVHFKSEQLQKLSFVTGKVR